MVQSIEAILPLLPSIPKVFTQNYTLPEISEPPPPMDEFHLFLVGIAFAIASLAYLAISRRQSEILSGRLNWRNKKNAYAKTPPRSLSPETKIPNNAAPPQGDYVDTFPPSRREALAELVGALSAEDQLKLVGYEVEEAVWTKSLLPFTSNYVESSDDRYTPTGISLGQVKTLGDFPDYAKLSGVPLPEPYHEFDIENALPRPYRPYRWPYHQTMSLTKLEPDWWIELENTYKKRIAQRQSLYTQEGENVLQSLPGSELACKELMEMVLQFLCSRYPHYFALSGDRRVFTNKILGTNQDVRAKRPLLVLLDNVPEDFGLMLRNPDTGYYELRAGMIFSAIGWNLGTKIGLRLHQVHGPVPDFKEKMQFSMDRFFAKLPTNRPIQRGSWGIEIDKPFYQPPGDPHETHWEKQDPSLSLDRLHLRVDWQTLRRLPLSGAVCFNFKALFTPVTEFRTEPYIPSLVTKILKEGKQNLMEYKHSWSIEHVALPALAQWEKEQKESGMVEKDWEPKTLEESPWFPGWREKWKEQQGY